MIGEPVALTVRRHIDRPSKTLLRAFAGRPTGYVTDARDGAGCLDAAIKPLKPDMRFCGPAVTAFCGPMDNLAAMAILDFARKGDVIVIATTGDETAATIGDLWALWARRIGVAAIVCDGLVRDVPGLLKAGIPVFARGVKPNSSFKHGPGEINMGVCCGGVTIHPGDIVSGDQDGVVVVPLARAAEVARQLEEVERKEAEAEAKVKRGEKLKFWDPVALQGRIRYVD
ncbi:MAG TPA: RraA family protein [Burkholderiales bacterium]|jgi:4-hydroxy-4-methyl-2-oxoglutarate aldolase|nr:RraA family protein [Burkholderiales bacterium]